MMESSDGNTGGGLIDLVVFPDRVPLPDDSGAPRRPSTWRGVGAFLFWAVAQTVPFVPVGGRLDANGFRPLLPPVAGFVYGVLLAAAFVWWFAGRGGPEAEYRRDTFRLRGVPAPVLARLPLVAVPLMVMTVASLVLVPRIIPVPPQRDTLLEAYAKMPFGVPAILVIAAVVAPLLEEFFFRGWLLRLLERRQPAGRAILFTAVIFSAAHFELFGFPTRLLFGAVAGYVAWSTRSIWPGVVLHGFYNATLLLGGTGGGRDVSEADLTRWAHTPTIFWPVAAVFVLAGLMVVWALRSVARAASEAPSGS
jgi:membrane protease YdiL (CAAX protease family)